MCESHAVVLHSNLLDSHAVNVKSMHLSGDGLLSPVLRTTVSLILLCTSLLDRPAMRNSHITKMLTCSCFTPKCS